MKRVVSKIVFITVCAFAISNNVSADSRLLDKIKSNGCNDQMTCKIDYVKMSSIENVESKISFRVASISPCTPDILSNPPPRWEKTIAECESYANDTKNNQRDRAVAMFVLGHFYNQVDLSTDQDVSALQWRSMKIWETALSVDPTFLDPLLEMGKQLAQNRKFAESQVILDHAERIDQNDWRVFATRSDIFQMNGNKLAALAAAERAYQINSEEPRTNFVYGLALHEVEKFSEAAPLLLKAAQRFDRSSINLFALWRAENPWPQVAEDYGKLNQPLKAVEALTSLLDSKPSDMLDFQIYAARAKFNADAGMYEYAVSDITKAMKLVPSAFPNDFNERQLEYLAKSGNAATVSSRLLQILNEGKLKPILQMQVFLNNQGYKSVEISGKFDDATRSALNYCLNDKDCNRLAGQAI